MRSSAGTTVLLSTLLLATAASAASPALKCEAGVASSLTACTGKMAILTQQCYLDTGAPCAASDVRVTRLLDKLERTVLARCPDGPSVQGAGYGALTTPAAVVARAREACLGEPATLAARTFGGPQGALLVGATPERLSCLGAAYGETGKLIATSAKLQGMCVRKAHKGGTCNTATLATKLATLEAKARTRIEAACPDLTAELKLSVDEYLARGTAQARCLVATGHGDSGPLDLDCGPRSGVPVPPRGQWVQVVLDEATWGTRCGDGSSYAFWLKLAPAGSPAWRVVTDMQGGGVCIFESDCAGVSPGLFRADDDGQPNSGYLSSSPTVNPFVDWTMLFMPYCTQDVHIGGGATSTFPSITVHRFGAINARAALRYLRDVLWAELEASDPEGWHPDRLQVMFAGESAGGFGVTYNYHYPLDDLRWVNTTAVPDAGLALDNGQPLGVKALAAVVGGTANPFGWNVFPMLPSYCNGNDCGVGPVLEHATIPRLKGTPYQQFLNVSNQVDNTQISTTFFADVPSWTNALRTTYCTERGNTGLFWFLPAQTTPFHTMLRTDSRFTAVTADGVVVRDYVFGAMTDPDGAVDRVDEGTLVADYPGVNPFPCSLGSPSGAFLEVR